MEPAGTVEQRATWLLEQMRETPMRRGALRRDACQLRRDLSRAISAQGIPVELAERISLQFALKFHRRDLFDEAEWRAIGKVLRREIDDLKRKIGMSDQRIIAALPKLSASQIAEFLEELNKTDHRIARTILHAAVNTAEPIVIGRRYLAEYRLVVRRLAGLDRTMARTVAAASFSASMPLTKAMEHLERFSALMQKYKDKPQLARRLARAGFRAKPGTEA
jgi:predicted nucleic acid-binding protein